MKSKLIAAAAAMLSITANAMNPFLPLWEYIPDGEPHVFEDPDQPGQYRVYVYGSHDSEITSYCGREQVVWSAPVDNLNDWRYDGVIFESIYDANGNELNPTGLGDILFAPDVAMATDANGKKWYYLYPNTQAWGRSGMVAKAERPDGPFQVCNWSKDNPTRTEGPLNFDPAVLVDDDGRVYAYWGFRRSYGAELDPATMATVKPGTQIVEDLIPSDDSEDGPDYRFFEASSMRKVGDKYVLIYSRWTRDGEFGLWKTNYTLAYAYSDNPLGPFTYGGTIIDGRGRDTDAAGKSIATATPSGNTHGSIFQHDGQWWVVYHRQTGLDEFSRQAMAAPIQVSVEPGKGGKVTITEGEYTSEGFQTAGLDPIGEYPAGIACYYTGPTPATAGYPHFNFSGSYVQATRHFGDPKAMPSDLELGACPVVNNTDGSVVGYKYFNFDTVKGLGELRFFMDLLPRGIDGTITLMAGAPTPEKGGIELCKLTVNKSDAMTRQKRFAKAKGIDQLTGKQPIYLLISASTPGESLCDIYSLGFAK